VRGIRKRRNQREKKKKREGGGENHPAAFTDMKRKNINDK